MSEGFTTQHCLKDKPEEYAMPMIRIEMFEGRPDEMKRELIQKVSTVTADTLKIPVDHVQVILTDVARKDWARGGVPYSEKHLEGEGYKHTK